MFGERLDALPTGCRQSLGEGIVLVQPYELPTEAGTETGMARERELTEPTSLDARAVPRASSHPPDPWREAHGHR
jgi:hypothetical protein